MKSNIDKFLSKSLSTYIFLLVIIFIMKLVGLDYFGLDLNNPIITKVDGLFNSWYLKDLWYVFTLWLYGYFIISITCNCNNKEMKIYSIMCIPIFYLATYLETKYSIMILNCFIDFGYLLLLSYLFNLRYKCVSNKKLILNYAKIIILNLFFQIISVITRVGYFEKSNYNFIVNFILDLDYLLLFIIYHKLYFEGGERICLEMVVSSFSQRKINLKKSLKKLQRNLDSFKKLNKVDKLTYIIYLQLSLLWNTLSVILILLVANKLEMKNDRIAEQQNEINALRLKASQEAQNNYLISQLKPCPDPAYIVPNPNCCYNYSLNGFGYNNGCGC